MILKNSFLIFCLCVTATSPIAADTNSPPAATSTVCTECKGTGTIACPDCGAKPSNECSLCWSTAKMTCWVCDGVKNFAMPSTNLFVDAQGKADPAMKLAVCGVTPQIFPYRFYEVRGSAEGTNFVLMMENGRGSLDLKLDQELPDTKFKGYKLTQYTEKFEDVPDPTIKGSDGKPILKKINASELTLRRGQDEVFILKRDKQTYLPDLSAKICFTVDAKFFVVSKGTTFRLLGHPYEVLSISKEAAGPVVAVKRADTAKEFSITASTQLSDTSQQWLKDYARALAQAKAERKYLFINFTGTDWCPYCVKLEEEVLSKHQFKSYARKNLVLLRLDFPRTYALSPAIKKYNDDIANKYGITGYPTVILLDSDGTNIGKTGYFEGGPIKYIENLGIIINNSRIKK
jgi:protein disulfide-isomerase